MGIRLEYLSIYIRKRMENYSLRIHMIQPQT
uniref:Uncharacterized protein n=1 Tax=virus sp. ctML55 TaxID=2827627 RepID=A0A8S5RIQ0_9VIRU|nr:MAG TPA: hypothetical protein [virus sp. ctML55]